MKTIALVFLSLFLTKSCHNKKDLVNNQSEKKDSTQPVLVFKDAPLNTSTKGIDNSKQENTTMVEYEALSRGYFMKIRFANNQLTIASDRNNAENGSVVNLTKEQYLELNDLLKSIDPKILPDLKWPTEKRYYDGAAHANLTITSNGTVYTGAGFDHGFPPAQIEKFVSKLVSYSVKK